MNSKSNDENKNKLVINTLIISSIIVILAVILCSLVVVIIPVIKNETSTITSSAEMKDGLKRIQEALEKISKSYIEEVALDKLVDGAIDGIASSTGDPYTRYMSEEEFKDVSKTESQVYGGIGVHITFDKELNGILVIGVMPNSPAQSSDIKAGDIIIKVEEKIVSKDNYTECIDNLKGEENSTVNVTINRKGNIFIKNIIRKKIVTNNVESNILEGNIGYIKILSFDTKVYEQFKKEYDMLISKNITGLVIDVRNNPGGFVSDTIDIAKLMLPKCDILKLVYKDGNQKVYKCSGINEIKIPLAVLVNSRSASASEILASAIKDSGKGVVIGNKTYGKGIVQNIEELNKGALSITTAKYYTSSGIEIHKNGIEPNIKVDLPDDIKNDTVIDKEKDTQLKKAIEYINSIKK